MSRQGSCKGITATRRVNDVGCRNRREGEKFPVVQGQDPVLTTLHNERVRARLLGDMCMARTNSHLLKAFLPHRR